MFKTVNKGHCKFVFCYMSGLRNKTDALHLYIYVHTYMSYVGIYI